VTRRALDDLLEDARNRIERLEPAAADAATARGALLIDIRAAQDRERDGAVPGSLHVPRTVLEWRLDPDSEWRSPHVDGLDRQLVLICDHGYSSLLAAATLVELGYTHVGDVVGGFAAWKAAGLPTTAPRAIDPGELPGMAPPEP